MAHSLIETFTCAAILSLALPAPAFAYIDPSVMTYTIQAIAGVAVALSAVAGVAFRRSRKALVRLLHIDEDARKEVESAVHRLDDEGNPIMPTAEDADDVTAAGVALAEKPASGRASGRDGAGERSQRPKRTRLPWPSRLWRSAAASAFLVGTLLFVAPVEMVAANESSLVFALVDVWQPLAIQTAIMAACLALVMSLFRGKGFDFVFMLAIAVGACFYIQAMFLNQDLPVADGRPFDISQHQDMAIISTVAWAAIIVVTFVLFAKRRLLGRSFATAISIALIIVQGSAIASIMAGISGEEETPAETTSMYTTANGSPVITKEGLFELSPKNNVVVFVLDTFDVVDLDSLIYSDSDVLSEMTGFTYFSNSTGSSTPTRYGIPFLLTGSWPNKNQTWDEYLDARYSSSTFLNDIVAQDYSIYVYTDTPGRTGMDHLPGVAVNIHPIDETRVHTTTTLHLEGVVTMLYQMALYRDCPWLLKEPFWFYTDTVNQALYDVATYEEDVDVSDRVGGTAPYIMDDALFYKQLVNRKLKTYDDGAKGSFRFIHLAGLHLPLTLDEHAERRSFETSWRQQALGSLFIVGEYLHQMKELGVYDDSYIIITADHGAWPWEDTIEQSERDGDMAGGPIMLVKPSQTAEEAARPCQVSEARTGHIDYPATVISAVGGNYAKYGTTVFDEHDAKRVRYYYWPTHNGSDDLIIYEYAIEGEVSDWSAWNRTGAEWPFNKPQSSAL